MTEMEMSPERYTHLLERAVVTASALNADLAERGVGFKTRRDAANAALTRWQEEVCRALELPLNSQLGDVLAGIEQWKEMVESAGQGSAESDEEKLDQIADVLEELPPLDTDPVGIRRHGKEDLIQVLARISEIVTPTGPEQDSNARD